jgi:hypothetical protein
MVTTFSKKNRKPEHYGDNHFFQVFSQFILSKLILDILKMSKIDLRKNFWEN